MIGLLVVSETGEPLGTVRAIEDFGAGDLLDIARPDGKTFMVPVASADIGDDRIAIDPVWAE